MSRSRASLCALAFAALPLISSCGDKSVAVPEREGDPNFVQSFDQKRMDAAMSEARSTLDTFVDALKAQRAGTTNFAVKKGFAHGEGNVEHLWITGLSVDGDGFQGKVGNEPVNPIGVKLGDVVKIPREEVEDWMFFADRKLQGGYTIVALAWGGERQAEMEKQMGIDWSKYEFLREKK